MSFRVYTDHAGGVDSYEGDANCSREGSVFVVWAGDRQIIYGPNGWIRVEADEEIEPSVVEVQPLAVEVTGRPNDMFPNPVSVVVENIEHARSRPPM